MFGRDKTPKLDAETKATTETTETTQPTPAAPAAPPAAPAEIAPPAKGGRFIERDGKLIECDADGKPLPTPPADQAQ